MSESRSSNRRVIPWAAVIACALIMAAAGLAIAGVYVLVGTGWALLTGAATCVIPAWLILRGLA